MSNTMRLFLITLVFVASPATAEKIAIIGTGEVAGALGPEFALQGHEIIYGSREPARASVQALVHRTQGNASAATPANAVVGAGIVVLAVPGALVESITKSLGDLSGKIIIDPTNHFVSGSDGRPEMAGDTSNGEIIQAMAPNAYVVKAFNTLNWSTMVDPDSSGGPVSIPLVGDNADAKAVVAGLVEEMGLEAIDVGPIRYARYIEGMLIVWINARFGSAESFEYHLRKIPEN